MTSRTAAFYGTGATLLVAYLAAANMPSQDATERDRAPRAAPTSGIGTLADGVRAQAAKLQTRMSQAPVPDGNARNPFAFGAAPRPPQPAERVVHAAVAEDAAPPVFMPPLPALTLMGIAEDTTPQGVKRTAIISGDGNALFMVMEGQPVGDRYKVTKIGADAVELEDLVTHAYRRIAMR
jgi:hypothetical protein